MSPIFCFPPRCLDHREGFALARHGQVAYAVRPVKRPFAADYSRTSRGGAWSWDLGFAAAQPTQKNWEATEEYKITNNMNYPLVNQHNYGKSPLLI